MNKKQNYSYWIIGIIIVLTTLNIYNDLKPILTEETDVFGSNAVITIPVKAPEGAVTRDEDVNSFLDRIKYFTEQWVRPGHNGGMNTHNVSATVYIKENEWDEVEFLLNAKGDYGKEEIEAIKSWKHGKKSR